jgi:hypothetical protein
MDVISLSSLTAQRYGFLFCQKPSNILINYFFAVLIIQGNVAMWQCGKFYWSWFNDRIKIGNIHRKTHHLYIISTPAV